MLKHDRFRIMSVAFGALTLVCVFTFYLQHFNAEINELRDERTQLHSEYHDVLQVKDSRIAVLLKYNDQLIEEKNEKENQMKNLMKEKEHFRKEFEEHKAGITGLLHAISDVVMHAKPKQFVLNEAEPPLDQLKGILVYFVHELRKVNSSLVEGVFKPNVSNTTTTSRPKSI